MTRPASTELSPVVKRIVVPCTADAAFRFFTRDFARWWPDATHSVTAMSSGGTARPRGCTFETRPGGRIVERGSSGEEILWGTIRVWDPPDRLVFSWHPGYDEAAAQEVEVTFRAVEPGTEVVLTHRGWDRLADRAAAARQAYDNGWESVFAGAYRRYVEQS